MLWWTLQGLITYANENIQNWFTTLADSFRVSDDMGKLRFQFKVFHKPLFGWKGSYVVTQVRIKLLPSKFCAVYNLLLYYWSIEESINASSE